MYMYISICLFGSSLPRFIDIIEFNLELILLSNILSSLNSHSFLSAFWKEIFFVLDHSLELRT